MRLDGDEDDFTIASYDRGIFNIRKDCPTIKVKVMRCCYKEEVRDFLDAACPVGRMEHMCKDFRTHYEEILRGEYEVWRLVSVVIRPAELELEFYNDELDDSEHILLGADGRQIRNLDVTFEVPHADDRPAAIYTMLLERNEAMADSGSTIVQAKFPHLHQHQVFMVTSLNPNELSVTDIFDL